MLAAALFFFGAFLPAVAQDQLELPYTEVFSDSQGVTHFRDQHLPWKETQTTGSLPVLATPFLDAAKIGFVRIPQSYRQDLHPAPAKQFVMVLSGRGELEVGDGERRTFGPGSVLLVTDTEGRGHRTTIPSGQDALLAFVPVP
jgi:quercetin dioxygenase-like cupin family protein